MRVKRRDAEQWMSHRLLPESLRERIRRYEQYTWQETRGVDEQNLLSNLPKDLRRDIKRHLCLALLRRVSSAGLFSYCSQYYIYIFTSRNELVLIYLFSICQNLPFSINIPNAWNKFRCIFSFLCSRGQASSFCELLAFSKCRQHSSR